MRHKCKRSELPVSGRRAREPRGRDVTARTRELSPGESSRDTARKPAQTLERAYDPISFHTEAYDSLRSEFFIRGDGLASRRDVEPSRATLPIGA